MKFQDKDKLIQNIKNQQTVEGFQAGELLSAELEQLQQERDLLREEISQFNCQVIQYRKELSHAETRLIQSIPSHEFVFLLH